MGTAETKTIIIFPHFADTVKAHVVLKKAGFRTEEIVPPSELCECCELALVIDPADQSSIEKILHETGLGSYRMARTTPNIGFRKEGI